jgi:hypothetical protein
MFCPAVFGLAALLSFPSVALSQGDTTARLMGSAKSAFNGRPLAGVMIAVPKARKFVVTDSSGTFLLTGLPAGAQSVLISYSGRETDEYAFELRRGKTKRLAIVLDVEAVDLAPVVVEAQHPDFSRNLAGFYERRRLYGAFGRFYTREDLERLRRTTLSHLLMGEGVTTRCTTVGCVPVRWSRGRLCTVAVAVDGGLFWELDYDHIPMEDVQAVEVYRGSYGVPVSVQMSLRDPFPREGLGPVGTCGSVMIWTR